MDKKIDSTKMFRSIWMSWKVCGFAIDRKEFTGSYILYSVFIQIYATFYFTLHLILAFFSFDNAEENLKNFAIGVSCASCTSKFIIYIWRLRSFNELESVLKELDSRIRSTKERNQFDDLSRSIQNIARLFLLSYTLVGVTAGATVVVNTERTLLYPAWFPFDWNKNWLNYFIANFFQVSSVCILLMQNFGNDMFVAICLRLLKGHIQQLGIRVSNIGYDNDDKEENELELIRCIKDQKNVYKLFTAAQNIYSLPMFIQILVATANICFGLVALVFYAETFITKFYFFSYLVGVTMEIFPACYYGSDFEDELEKLPYAIFSCEWTTQTPKFKKYMITFVERSLRPEKPMAAGLLRIHIDTFFSILRGTYSLFSVVLGLS